MADPVGSARDAINELRDVIDWLAASLLPGTAKPYRAPQMSAEKRAELDALARQEWRERSGIAPGETPPVYDLDIADLLSEILTAADSLADRVCWAVQRPVDPPAVSAFADPTPRLDLIADYLRTAVVTDPGIVPVIEDTCDGFIFRAHSLLGLVGDGQLLAATCPWCAGRTARHPVGGARTLRIRAQLPAGVRTVTKVDPKEVRWLVVCESGTCEPPAAQCGERLRGRPAWPLKTEGEWLAQQIEAAMAS